MKVTRIITYDMPEGRLAKQLGQSMPDGMRVFAPDTTITLVTLPSTFGAWQLVKAIWRSRRG